MRGLGSRSEEWGRMKPEEHLDRVQARVRGQQVGGMGDLDKGEKACGGNTWKLMLGSVTSTGMSLARK